MKNIRSVIFVAIVLMAAISAAQPDPQDAGYLSKEEFDCQMQKAVEEKNKQLLVNAYQTIFGDQDFDAVDSFFRPDYIQHNPNNADGSEALKAFAKAWTSGREKEQIDIRRVSAEGDLVWLQVKMTDPSGQDLVIMNAFRIQDGLIAEHWDVIQPTTNLSQSKNPHPFF